MKTYIFIFTILIINTMSGQTNFYDFKINDIDGKPFDLSQLKGKKIMVVNVASKCGLTPQYEKLQALYEKYKNQNFIIIGFPANNFLNQEPGNAEEIKNFCKLNYGVSFPIMEKISVKGKDIHPIYQWLTQKEKNGIIDAPIQWNFQKFLIDETGNLVMMIPPKDSPDNEKVIKWIEKQ